MKIWEVQCDVANFATIYLRPDTHYKYFLNFSIISNKPDLPPLSGEFSQGLPIGDFSYIMAGVMAAQRATIATLPNQLRQEVETFPLSITGHDVGIIRTLNVVDCLDEGSSEIVRFTDGEVFLVNRYVLREALLKETFLFKLPQFLYSRLYATEHFYNFINEQEFTGLKFDLIYEG